MRARYHMTCRLRLDAWSFNLGASKLSSVSTASSTPISKSLNPNLSSSLLLISGGDRGLLMEDRLIDALDERIRAGGGYDEEEVARVIHLGLLCAYPDAGARPTMRQVLKVLEGKLNEGSASECDIDDVDAYLLKQMKSKDMWFNYDQSSGGSGSHPTIEDFRKMLSSSMSFSWSKKGVRSSHSRVESGTSSTSGLVVE